MVNYSDPGSSYVVSGSSHLQSFVVCILALALYSILKRINARGKMPPGPVGVPFLGNNRYQMPALKPWRKFTEWNKRYGTGKKVLTKLE
jgi:hypothetical protein